MSSSLETSAAYRQYVAMNAASKAHAERARQVIPSGLSRGLLRHAPFPFYTTSGHGIFTTDLDGNERRDFHGNYSAMIHGQAHPEIIAACNQQIPLGTSFSAPATAVCACIARAKGFCAGAANCHDCVWQHKEQLIRSGCDWADEHSAVVAGVCGGV